MTKISIFVEYRIFMISEQQKEGSLGFFIIDYSLGGGVERVTADLMRQFSENGFKDLHLITLRAENNDPLIEYPKSIALEILDRERTSTMKFAQKLSIYLKKFNIKHLIFQGDNMTITLEVLEGARMAECKAYPQYHGSPYAYLRKYSDALKPNFEKKLFSLLVYPFKKLKLKKVIQNSEQGFFCVSEGSKNELADLYRDNVSVTSKLKVIRNPIKLHAKSGQEKSPWICFVSRLESKHKNAFLAVKAWALVAHQYPNWTLKVLGDGGLRNEMEAYCKKRSISNIHFLGFVTEVQEILEKSSISLNVSNCEGFSMSIAEAITANNAVAATDSDGGLKDMIIHHKTGLLSPKNDAQSLAKNIEKLISEDRLRSQLADAAYKHLSELASEDQYQLWLKELFN